MPIVDIHVYFGAPPESVRQGTLPEIQRVLGQVKVSAALLASGRGATGDFRRGNEQLQQAIDGRVNLFGLVAINPSYPDESAEEVRRRLSHPLFRGIKVARQLCRLGADLRDLIVRGDELLAKRADQVIGVFGYFRDGWRGAGWRCGLSESCCAPD